MQSAFSVPEAGGEAGIGAEVKAEAGAGAGAVTGVGNRAGAKPGAGFEAEVRGEATANAGTGHHVVGVPVFWTHNSKQTMKINITDFYSLPDTSRDSPGTSGSPRHFWILPHPYGNP